MTLWTNKGKYEVLGVYFNDLAEPTNLYAALATAATAPTVDINTKSELTELANGNGYTTGGIQLSRNATDFPSLTEDDAADRAYVRVKNLVWTASGGNLGPARYLILTDDNATQGSRKVLASFDLGADRTVSDTQSLTISNAELRLN